MRGWELKALRKKPTGAGPSRFALIDEFISFQHQEQLQGTGESEFEWEGGFGEMTKLGQEGLGVVPTPWPVSYLRCAFQRGPEYSIMKSVLF